MVHSNLADLWDEVDTVRRVPDKSNKSDARIVRCRYCLTEFVATLTRLKGHLLGARARDGGTLNAAPCASMSVPVRQRLLDTYGPRLVAGENTISEGVLRFCTAPYVVDPELLPAWLARTRRGSASSSSPFAPHPP
ncbi:hypothetical protein O6H91_05G087400 [Diphasiastrum complanatum]|uniref:Uncharacterized protein n=1 Tax=Diphasiastrum complanatum TaxID=34168 RepID=A0ACC2DQK3_DIPCM|nr:hypothetical protein O6H91_05G087400 [Diphasiastrum complanatum]